MSRIRSRDTKPEMSIRKALYAAGYRFRVANKDLPGSPDISIKKFHVVIFVNGCFWHGHDDCKMYHLPKTNVEFWQSKIERNRTRDAKNLDIYKQMGWTAIVIWECQLRHKSDNEATIARLLNTLHYLTGRGEAVRVGFGDHDGDFNDRNYAIAAEPEAKFGKK